MEMSGSMCSGSPLNLDAAVRDFAVSAVWRNASPAEFKTVKIPKGERHFVFRVVAPTLEPPSVIVRINAITSSHEREKARREATVLSRLGGSVAPRLLTFDEGERFGEPAMCMEDVAGLHHDMGGLPVDSISSLGQAVARFHVLDVSSFADQEEGTHAWTVANYLLDRMHSEVERRLPVPEMPIPTRLRESMNQARAVADRRILEASANGVLDVDDPPVLLHSDIGAENVLWPTLDNPILIDWEDTRIGDPAEEVGYIIAENWLDDIRRQAFLSAYCRMRETSTLFPARVSLWEPLSALFSAMWWVDRATRRMSFDGGKPDDGSAPKTVHYYLERAEQRLRWFSTNPAP